MKKMKKILTLILTVCFMLPCFSTVSYAADGVIFFTDLETTVGATFTITGTVVARNDVLGNATVQMTYDTAYMKFISGEGVTKNSDGNLTYSGSGNGSSDRVEFDMTFQALKEGSTRMNQGTASVTNKNGRTVACETGFADVTVGPGDPSLIEPDDETTTTDSPSGESKGLMINGVQYTPSGAFSDNTVPAGFTTAEVTYQGTIYTGIESELTGTQGLYLSSPEGKSDFFLYNAQEDVFYPCEEIMISDEYSLIVLAEKEDVFVEDGYVETDIIINGTKFPAWYNPEKDEYYLIYAIGSATGEKSFYLYDSVEHTYQRVEMAVETVEEPAEVKEDTLTKIKNVIVEYLVWIMVGTMCLIAVLVILLITLAVKLAHRNAELDDLYDEYQIDVEDEVIDQPKKKQENKKNGNTFVEASEDEYLSYYDEDEYEEEDDDDVEYEYEEDEYDASGNDYYEELDDLADIRREMMEESEKTTSKYDEYYDDDDFFDEDIEEEDDVNADLKKSVNTDTFEMDFIEFD